MCTGHEQVFLVTLLFDIAKSLFHFIPYFPDFPVCHASHGLIHAFCCSTMLWIILACKQTNMNWIWSTVSGAVLQVKVLSFLYQVENCLVMVTVALSTTTEDLLIYTILKVTSYCKLPKFTCCPFQKKIACCKLTEQFILPDERKAQDMTSLGRTGKRLTSHWLTPFSQFKCCSFMQGNFDCMERYHQTLMDWKDLRENASKTESAHDKTPDPWPTGQFIKHFLSQPD